MSLSKTTKLYFASAALLTATMIVGWGTGMDGDMAFALGSALVALLAFGVGFWAKRWWAVPAAAGCWFVGWMEGGSALDPDSYAAAVAFFAPGIAIFVALGVGAGRGLRDSASRRDAAHRTLPTQ